MLQNKQRVQPVYVSDFYGTPRYVGSVPGPSTVGSDGLLYLNNFACIVIHLENHCFYHKVFCVCVDLYMSDAVYSVVECRLVDPSEVERYMCAQCNHPAVGWWLARSWLELGYVSVLQLGLLGEYPTVTTSHRTLHSTLAWTSSWVYPFALCNHHSMTRDLRVIEGLGVKFRSPE